MRHLSALFALCLVTLTASASDPVPTAGKPVAASAAASAASTPPAKPAIAPPLSPAAQRAKEEQDEIDLQQKIAARLAEMREHQKARAAAAARARKLAEATRKQEDQAAAVVATIKAHRTDWSYEGETGPANWSKMNVDWAKCGMGKRQSPVDIRDGIKVDLEQITFDYHPSSFTEIDNGRTVDVTVGGGNFITVGNQTYELQGFHFHRPSEERINGKGTEMVMHLVHKGVDGSTAIVAVLLERGKQHGLIQTIWNNLPLEKNTPVSPSIVIDPSEALPSLREYYTYMGSLSTPPCTEGVLYLVMKQPMQASPAQMALFSRLYPLNARPVQSSFGRMIKESN
jgi:carbonic anhydrase